MNKFENIYYKIINEMKHITSPERDYKINDDAFKPILYKNICICVSALNSDPFHVLKRLNSRTNKKYSIDTIITIIKRYVDKDPELKNIFKDKNRSIYSCSIQSKEFNDINKDIKKIMKDNDIDPKTVSPSYIKSRISYIKNEMLSLLEFDKVREYANSISSKRISVMKLYKYFYENIDGLTLKNNIEEISLW